LNNLSRLEKYYVSCIYILHICVLTFQILKQVTDLNKILHDNVVRIIPKLVHLKVSKFNDYNETGAHSQRRICLEMIQDKRSDCCS
jgi:hypothetical protein